MKISSKVACSLIIALGVVGCADDFASVDDPPSDLVARYGLEPLPLVIHPEFNPPDPPKIELGRLLFFDPVLSGTKDVACGTCHIPELGLADGRDLPIGPSGRGLGPDRVFTDPEMVHEARNSMTIINVGYNRYAKEWTSDGFMFWDGRKRRLENLVLLPLREFSEMRGDAYAPEVTLDSVLARLRKNQEYETRFQAAFPDRAAAVQNGDVSSAIDSLTLTFALAQFVRSAISDNSAYDRFVDGDESALTPEQKHGLVLFYGKAGCADCHTGSMFSDFGFHVVGARQLGPGFQETPHEDFGRWNATELESDRWAFRTPSLRNVAETSPYMHSGGYATLADVVDFFDRGGGDHPRIPADRIELRPLHLTPDEKAALIAFMESLTDLPDIETPDSVPSRLEPPKLER